MAKQRRSREHWSRRVEDWTESGRSAGEFAASRGVNGRTLSWWRWRLRTETPTEDATPGFLPVTVEGWAEPEAVASGLVEAALPNGVTLRFAHRMDRAGLRELAGAFGVGAAR